MKYKVLVVDDKPLICRALSQTIHWEKLNCEVIGTAENGIEAKEKIDQLKPQIIITDIKMPGMDGLELTAYVRQYLPDTEIIMITGYQEFEYAKKALQLGVFDLVLKPLDNRKIEEILSKVAAKLQEKAREKEFQRKIMEENKVVKDQLKTSLKVVRGKFLSDLISGRRIITEVTQDEIIRLRLDNFSYGLLAGRARVAESEKRAAIFRYLSEKISAAEEKDMTAEMQIGTDWLLVLPLPPSVSSRTYQFHVKNVVLDMQKGLRERWGEEYRMCFAVSQLAADVRKIRSIYEQVLDLLNTAFFSADKDILFVSDYRLVSKETPFTIMSDLEHFYQVLESSSEEETRGEADRIIKKIMESSEGDVFKIKCLLGEICITVRRHYKTTAPPEKLPDVNRVMDEINKLMDAKQAKEYLQHFLAEIKKEISAGHTQKNPLAADAMDYVKSHYNQNITLSSLADYLNTNASYLSRLLKKETGRNFVDILTSVRVEAAKRLLDQPGSKVAEVGEKVGYSEYAYFYQVFKKTEGISPSDYKRNSKKI